MKTIDKINSLLDEHGIPERSKKRELSNVCGISYESVRKWFTGETDSIDATHLKAIAKKYSVSVDWLLNKSARPQRIVVPGIKGGIKTLKILGIAQLGPEGYWDGFDNAEGYIDVPSEDENAYALILRGDSMMPAIRSGWAAWCEPSKGLVPLEYVMIKLTDGQCMIKELIKETAHDVTVQSINQDYGRMTIARSDIEHIHYVAGIVPPSKIKEAEPA